MTLQGFAAHWIAPAVAASRDCSGRFPFLPLLANLNDRRVYDFKLEAGSQFSILLFCPQDRVSKLCDRIFLFRHDAGPFIHLLGLPKDLVPELSGPISPLELD
jgi:hypothetical protein